MLYHSIERLISQAPGTDMLIFKHLLGCIMIKMHHHASASYQPSNGDFKLIKRRIVLSQVSRGSK
jgi:hypothetical protein